jgi:hypothetical protein
MTMMKTWRMPAAAVLSLLFAIGLAELVLESLAGGSLNHGAGVNVGSATVGASHPPNQLISQLLVAVFLWLIWRGNWGAWILAVLFYAYVAVTSLQAAFLTGSPYVACLVLIACTQLAMLFAPDVRRRGLIRWDRSAAVGRGPGQAGAEVVAEQEKAEAGQDAGTER